MAKIAGDRVDREHDIAGFNQDQGKKQRCRRTNPVNVNEESTAVQLCCYGIESPYQSYREIVFQRNVVVAQHQHTRSREQQHRTENVHDPVEPLDDGYAAEDHRAAQDNRPKNSPEQYPVLLGQRHLEMCEHHRDYEDVVDGQRLFHQVTGKKLDGCFRPA